MAKKIRMDEINYMSEKKKNFLENLNEFSRINKEAKEG